MAKPKQVPSQASPTRPQTKTVVPSNPTLESGTIRFSFAEMDDGGHWPAHKVRGTHIERLLKRLKALESLTPDQLVANHTLTSLDMGKCANKAATARLANHYEGLDVLHEIRIAPSEALRLHGRLVGRFFHVIWWDPKHEVWPDAKRNVR